MRNEIFEKWTKGSMRPFKMRFFLKKWMAFEERYGSEEKVEEIKRRAEKYVESVCNE